MPWSKPTNPGTNRFTALDFKDGSERAGAGVQQARPDAADAHRRQTDWADIYASRCDRFGAMQSHTKKAPQRWAHTGRQQSGRLRRGAQLQTVRAHRLGSPSCKPRCSSPSGRRMARRSTTSATATSKPRCTAWCNSTPRPCLPKPRPLPGLPAAERCFGMMGSRLFVANPPHTLFEQLQPVMPWLAEALAQFECATSALDRSRSA